MKTLAKWTSTLITTIFVLIIVFALFSVVSSRLSGEEPQMMGYQLKSVLSGSMEPGIKTGSVIAIKPTKNPNTYQKGDVITFKSIDNANVLITHRIMEVQTIDSQIHYVTKGDNNDANDTKPIPAINVIGHYDGFTIPYIGYGLNFYNTDAGKIILLILPGLLLVGYAVYTTWRTIASIEDKEEQQPSDSPKTI
jgi:signal peptidase I